MAIVKSIWEALGATPQKRVKNLILIIIAVTGMIILTMNLRLGYNTPGKCGGFWLEWGPAADIKVDYKRGG
jgi:hypothetical protein